MPTITSTTVSRSLLELPVNVLELIACYASELDALTELSDSNMSRSLFPWLALRVGSDMPNNLTHGFGFLRLHYALLNAHLQRNAYISSLSRGECLISATLGLQSRFVNRPLAHLYLQNDRMARKVATSSQLSLVNKLMMLVRYQCDKEHAPPLKLVNSIVNAYDDAFKFENICWDSVHSSSILDVILPFLSDTHVNHLLKCAYRYLNNNHLVYSRDSVVMGGLWIIRSLLPKIPLGQLKMTYDVILKVFKKVVKDIDLAHFQLVIALEEILPKLLNRLSIDERNKYRRSYTRGLEYRDSRMYQHLGYAFFASVMPLVELDRAIDHLIQSLNDEWPYSAMRALKQLIGYLTPKHRRQLAETIFNVLIRLFQQNDNLMQVIGLWLDLSELIAYVKEELTQDDADQCYEKMISAPVKSNSLMASFVLPLISCHLSDLQIRALLKDSREVVFPHVAHRLAPNDQENLALLFFKIRDESIAKKFFQLHSLEMRRQVLEHFLDNPALLSKLLPIINLLSLEEKDFFVEKMIEFASQLSFNHQSYYQVMGCLATKVDTAQAMRLFQNMMDDEKAQVASIDYYPHFLVAGETLLPSLSIEQQEAYFAYVSQKGRLNIGRNPYKSSLLSLYVTLGCPPQFRTYVDKMSSGDDNPLGYFSALIRCFYPYFEKAQLSANIILKLYDPELYRSKLDTVSKSIEKMNQYVSNYLKNDIAIAETAFKSDFIDMVKGASIVRNPIRRFFSPVSLSTHSTEALLQSIANPVSGRMRELLIQEFKLESLETEDDVRQFLQTVIDGEYDSLMVETRPTESMA